MNQPLSPKLPILLVDDERPWLRSLCLTLERRGGLNHFIECTDSRQVMDLLARQEMSLVLLDLTMPYVGGEELLGQISQNHPHLPVIIISGLNQVDSAVNCMKKGAFDYFVKTLEEDRLTAGILRAIRMRELEQENRKLGNHLLREELEHPGAFAGILTEDPQMRAVFRYIEAVAPSSHSVLICGESGTGKELVARALHQLGRPSGPWVAVNVAGLDDNIFSDTLFGHLRGAFTGADQNRPGMIEQAAGGTLFLDEIGDLSPASQVKLLRLLQEGEYFPIGADKPKRSTARIVAATNQSLQAKQAAGVFRKDLFYRLQSHQIHLPALRERLDDLPLLLDHFLNKAAEDLGRKKPTPPAELLLVLSTYHFPGNVRELEGMVQDAVLRHQSGKLSMDSFKRAIGIQPSKNGPLLDPAENGTAPLLTFSERLPTLDEADALLVEEALRRARGNQSLAAGMLGISRPALSKRLKKQREQVEETP